MLYDQFLSRMSRKTGLPVETIRRVMQFVPDVLMELAVGSNVQTPLGTFKKVQTKSTQVKLFGPDEKLVDVPAKTVVRLTPSARLLEKD